MLSGFIYAAELWCEDCGLDICRRLLTDGKGPPIECSCGYKGAPSELADDESTFGDIVIRCPKCRDTVKLDDRDYDSDEFPKGAIADAEADSVQYCGAGEDCINAIEIGDLKCGMWLENDLTSDGIESLKESIEEYSPEIRAQLLEWYPEARPEEDEEDEEEEDEEDEEDEEEEDEEDGSI